MLTQYAGDHTTIVNPALLNVVLGQITSDAALVVGLLSDGVNQLKADFTANLARIQNDPNVQSDIETLNFIVTSIDSAVSDIQAQLKIANDNFTKCKSESMLSLHHCLSAPVPYSPEPSSPPSIRNGSFANALTASSGLTAALKLQATAKVQDVWTQVNTQVSPFVGDVQTFIAGNPTDWATAASSAVSGHLAAIQSRLNIQYIQ